MKRCNKCGVEKSLDSFPLEAVRPDGHKNICKACCNAKALEWRQANRGRIAASNRSYYEQRRESEAKRSRQYQAEHTTERRAYTQRYRKEHPDWTRAVRTKWKVLARNRSANAERELVRLDVVYERDGGACHICHCPVARTDATLDHLIPVADGGPHTYQNVALAHRSCNARRGRQPVLGDKLRPMLTAGVTTPV